MSSAINDGVRIYFRCEGARPPLVLQHGMSSNLTLWYDDGSVEPLACRYQVILIDARGHGESDKLHYPALYSASCMAGDVVAVPDAVGVEKAHFFGYSMGAYLGQAVAKYAAERLQSRVMGGAASAVS